VRFTDFTLDVRMLWLSELATRDCMDVGLNYQRQKCGQWTVISEGLTENAGRENDGPKMTTGREMAREKSTVSTETTLQ